MAAAICWRLRPNRHRRLLSQSPTPFRQFSSSNSDDNHENGTPPSQSQSSSMSSYFNDFKASLRQTPPPHSPPRRPSLLDSNPPAYDFLTGKAGLEVFRKHLSEFRYSSVKPPTSSPPTMSFQEKIKRSASPQADLGSSSEGSSKTAPFSMNTIRFKKVRELDEMENKSRSGVDTDIIRESLRVLQEDEKKTKSNAAQRLSELSLFDGTADFMSSPPKEVLVEKYFHPDHMSSSEKQKIELKEVRDKFKMSESDCVQGDSERQSVSCKWNESQLALVRKAKKVKRKDPPTSGSEVLKKTKSVPQKEPSSTGGEPTMVSTPEKAKTPSGVSGAIPSPPTSSTAGDKGKGPQVEETPEVTTVNFPLPSSFLMDGVLDKTKIFPNLGKFLLPAFKERYWGVSVDETGSHVAGLSFLAFQASLCLFGQLEELQKVDPSVAEKLQRAEEGERKAREDERAAKAKAEALSVQVDDLKSLLETSSLEKEELQNRLKEVLERASVYEAEVTTTKAFLTVRKKQVGELKSSVKAAEAKTRALEEKLLSFEALTRLKVRAAIMRRHLQGKNPLAGAEAEVTSYLEHVGTEEDLDQEDRVDDTDSAEAKTGDVLLSMKLVNSYLKTSQI